MKKKSNDFLQQLQQRDPDALKQQRVIVNPVDRLASQEQAENTQVDKSTKPQVGKTTNTLADKPTNPQGDNSTNPQKDNPTSGQAHKTTSPQVEKYTTHLRPATIKAVKRYAFEHDLKDYEVVQTALDRFLT